MATLADALRQFGAAYLATHALSTPQAKAWRSIVACRTPALGGQRLDCDTCGHSHWQYHSCRNRHCPQCGMRTKDAWLQGRLAEVLPVPYAHLVFTLPHSLNALYGAHPRWVIDTLFASTAQTLSEFAANDKWMGCSNGTPAFSLVLHTWTQDLQRHIHLHAVMACGVLDKQDQWHPPVRKPDFLFPVQALSRVFRGKFMQALTAAHRDGKLEHDPQGQNAAWQTRQQQLYQHDWVVYAKTPLGGPAQVLEYLSRYTHRTAISNERIRSINATEVAFTVRADDKGAKRRVRLDGAEFVRRFLLHVLPTGIKRIRHYGVAGIKLQRGQAQRGKAGLADACCQCAGDGVGPRIHGAGGQAGYQFVSVLQDRAPARHGRATGASPLAHTRWHRGTTEPGATMKRGQMHGSGSQHHGLGVSLRVAFAKPWRGSTTHPHDGVTAAPVCVRRNAGTQRSAQARS